MNRARNYQQGDRLLSATSGTADGGGAGLDSTDGHTLFDQIKEKNVNRGDSLSGKAHSRRCI